MEQKTIDTFKNNLMKEKELVISELKTVGRVNPDNPKDWEPVENGPGVNEADPNDDAVDMENYALKTNITDQLELRLAEINKALEHIGTNNYGICDICSKPIEDDRLTANPAALTCKEHAE